MIAAFMVPPAPEKKPKYVELDAAINAVYDAGARSGDVFDALESIPAADVRPVVRGKWVVSRTDYGWNCAEFPTHCKCTVCGREVPYQDKDNFCPNCGADMRQCPEDEAAEEMASVRWWPRREES